MRVHRVCVHVNDNEGCANCGDEESKERKTQAGLDDIRARE